MLKRSRLILSVIALSIVSTTAIASSDKLSSAKLHDNVAEAAFLKSIGINYQHEAFSPAIKSDHVVAKLNDMQKKQLSALLNLKATITKSNSPESSALLTKLDKLIADKQSKADSAKSDGQLNFLIMRLSDALSMIQAVNTAAENSIKIVLQMQTMAADAASGTYSSTQLADLNFKFQALKNALNYVQTIDLINGEKTLSGGDIIIKFGNGNDERTRLVYPVPAFDSHSLGLTTLTIDSSSNAQAALGSTYTALEDLNVVLARLNTGALDDAETAIASLPYVLNQDYNIYQYALNIILQACNGTYSQTQRSILDLYFDQAKALLNQNQSYASLQGVKMLGGGRLSIQIGDDAEPDTTLSIDLPTTDVTQLGLDRYNVQTQDSAYEALSAILYDIRDFTYGPVYG